jgi:drug/metabolite transporter (DMT)-like permease
MSMASRAADPLVVQDKSSGRFLVASAALLWSSGGFFGKAPLFDGWPVLVLAFWRVAWAAVVLIPFIRSPRWTWRLLPMAGFFVAMNWTYLTSMLRGEASNAIWLQMTAPVWVFLFSALYLRETILPRDWLLLACGAAGVGLILWFELQGEQPEAVVYGLLSGVFYGGVVLSLRQLRDLDSAWLVAVNHVSAALAFLPFVVANPAYWPQGKQWLFLVAFGMLQMGLPYILFARGLKSIPSHEASGIGLLEPVLLPVWVYLAWHNAPNYVAPRWWTLVGGALILIGLSWRYLGEAVARPARRERRHQP